MFRFRSIIGHIVKIVLHCKAWFASYLKMMKNESTSVTLITNITYVSEHLQMVRIYYVHVYCNIALLYYTGPQMTCAETPLLIYL